MADISKIKLPSGTTYDIKDAVARDLISGNGTFVISWNGNAAPTVANVPAGVKITYNSTEYTGTLAAGTTTLKKFYLVKSSTQQDPTLSDVYDEYITVALGTDPETYAWEKIGDTQIKLSQIVTGVTPTTSKLVTTTVTGVSGSVTASKVSQGTDQTTAKGTGTASTSTDAWLKGWSYTANTETLTLSGVTMDTQTTKQVKIDTASVTVPKAATSATTVATGSLNANGTGASVVTGINVS